MSESLAENFVLLLMLVNSISTFFASVPRRSTTVISPATANAGRADGSPASQRGRADVGRSVLLPASEPSPSRMTCSVALAGAAAAAGASQRGRAEAGRLLPTSSSLSSITSVFTVSPGPGMSSGGTAGAAAASPQRGRPLSAGSNLSFGSP